MSSMGIWILIIWLNGNGKALLAQEFDEQEACENALSLFKAERTFGSDFNGICAPKFMYKDYKREKQK